MHNAAEQFFSFFSFHSKQRTYVIKPFNDVLTVFDLHPLLILFTSKPSISRESLKSERDVVHALVGHLAEVNPKPLPFTSGILCEAKLSKQS